MNFLKPKSLPTLSSTRLLLRSPTPLDTSSYHDILSCKEVTQYTDLPHQPTLNQSRRFVKTMIRLSTSNKNGNKGAAWIITLPSNKTIIGSIRINRIEKKSNCGIIAYELHPEFWGNGYASEAIAMLVEHAHTTLSLNRLEAWCSTDNIASHKALLNNGFRHEGTLRQRVHFRENYWDVECFARIASDNRKK